MRKIGFLGGHTVYELGPASDVVFFFHCLKTFVVGRFPAEDWGVLTDRLYRRYLRLNELEHAASLMLKAQEELSRETKFFVMFDEYIKHYSESWLNSDKDSLDGVFSRYFELFFLAKQSAISFFSEFKIYQPVRLVVSEMPMLMLEKRRPLDDYENLDINSLPFWLD